MLSVVAHKKIKSSKGDRILEIDFSIEGNTILGVFGNSGEGKTTLFNLIAGIVNPEQGKIICQNVAWYASDGAVNVPTQHRNIGYIFQRDNLFPHFTVGQNILYAVPKAQQGQVDLAGLLESVELGNMKDRYPHELSGGQVQRVALARALAQKAKIILMDEPFSALDLEIKIKLYRLIKKFKADHGMTILIATHDLYDLSNLCEEILWIKDHKIKGTQSHPDFEKQIQERIQRL